MLMNCLMMFHSVSPANNNHMKTKVRRFIFSLLAISLLPGYLNAQDFPEKPVPPRLVNDFAGMLKDNEISALENKLVAFSDSTTTQIAIVTVASLHGYDKADYAQRLFDKWGIGQKGKNNGLLILIKPKTDSEAGQIFITQGYGLEGAIPDLPVSEIIDREILPSFRNSNYYGGLDKATDILMAMARGDFPAGKYVRKSNGGDNTKGFFIAGFIVFIIIMMISSGGGKNNKHIGSKGLPFWLLLSMMNSGGSHGGSWGGFSGGGGLGGGGGGGGFGGFGGGMSGGGGAGGSW
jgi:uncharacterized protein